MVTGTSAIAFAKNVKRPPSGFVTVKETVDASVSVQMLHRLFHVGNGVQHKTVAIADYAECGSGKEIHKSLEHAAHVGSGIFQLYQ